MVNLLKIGAIALGIAAIGGYGVWAGVIVRTGADGSVTVVTDDVRVDTNREGAVVSTNNSSQSFSSQSFSSHQSFGTSYSNSPQFSRNVSSSSTVSTSSSGSIPIGHLSTRDYVLLVSGDGEGTVTMNGRTIGRLSELNGLRLNGYLQPGNNTIAMAGHGWTDIQVAVVEAAQGHSPYFNRSGTVTGARQVLSRQRQSRSGGSWNSIMVVNVE
ncbi:MAG: hypothetical protein AB4050_04575 [Synechococcus sp.]